MTVLFADVKGSMEMAEQLGPEEWRSIMQRFFSIQTGAVQRFEGTVDKFTGDGIMALFGAPIAHEDHARRACYAALHLQRELAAADRVYLSEHTASLVEGYLALSDLGEFQVKGANRPLRVHELKGRERELREAHRLFTEIGASGHAERLAGELAMPAS